MGLGVSGKKKDPVPTGTHLGVCYMVVDLGTQHSDMFDKDTHQVLIGWELPEERISFERDGQTIEGPRAISKTYTASISPKSTLGKHLVAWRGAVFTDEETDRFELSDLIGMSAMITVVHNDNGNAKVESVTGLPKGMNAPEAENAPIFFSMEEGFDIPENAYDWVKDTIKESKEYKAQDDNIEF